MTRDGSLRGLRKNRAMINKTGQNLIPATERPKVQQGYNVIPVMDIDVPTGSKIIRGAKPPKLEEKK